MPRDEPDKGERKRMRAAEKIQRKLKRRRKRQKAKTVLKEISEQLDFVTRTLVEHIDQANRRYESGVLTTQLPIVAAIVYKETFRIGMSRAQQTNVSFADRRQNVLLSRVEQYVDFGMHTEDEMRQFAATWPEVIQDRNSVAHTASADDVIGILPFASAEMALVLERGCELIFGRHPLQWEHATVVEKCRRVSA